MKFCIYYADGKTYQGDTNNLEEVRLAPSWDVITVKHAAQNEKGFSLRHGCDFYGWSKLRQSDGKWTCKEHYWSGLGDLFGLANYFRDNELEFQKVLIGKEVHDTTFKDIIARAIFDGCLCQGECEHG